MLEAAGDDQRLVAEGVYAEAACGRTCRCSPVERVTPEQSAWKSVQPLLTQLGLDPRRVENSIGSGHPDVDYSHGNIELKAMANFPHRLNTPIEVPCFTGEQAGWLAQRWKAGGNAWLWVRVSKGWYLFDGWTALIIQKRAPVSDWIHLAAMIYPEFSYGWRSAGNNQHITYARELHHWLVFNLDQMPPDTRARAMRLRACLAVESVAATIQWTPKRVQDTETGRGSDSDVNSLLDFWNS